MNTPLQPFSRRARFGAFALAAFLAVPAVLASDYSDGWGPPVGNAIPEASLMDQSGQPQTFAGLLGPRGLLIFFNRSADW